MAQAESHRLMQFPFLQLVEGVGHFSITSAFTFLEAPSFQEGVPPEKVYRPNLGDLSDSTSPGGYCTGYRIGQSLFELEETMEKVTSPDGTQIAFYRRGAGPPLILVSGSGAANPIAWTAVLPALEEHFTVCAVDRRGRGESGDGPNYAIEREFEDIAAVVDSIGEPANLLGHSFGALCVLETALLTRNLRKLILYEPAIPLPGIALYADGVIDQLQALLDAGDREGVLTMLYRDIVMMPPHEFEQLRSSPAWSQRVTSAHNVVRESRAEEQYTFDAQRFKDLHTPTLLLLGGDSPQFLKEATEAVDIALPNSRIGVMPGQQHTAMYSAPDLFLQEVLGFLLEPRSQT